MEVSWRDSEILESMVGSCGDRDILEGMEGSRKGWKDGCRDIGDSSGGWKNPSRGRRDPGGSGRIPAAHGSIPAGIGAVAAAADSLAEIPGMPAGTAAMPAGNGGGPVGRRRNRYAGGKTPPIRLFNGVLRQLRPLATRIHSSKP